MVLFVDDFLPKMDKNCCDIQAVEDLETCWRIEPGRGEDSRLSRLNQNPVFLMF